MSEITYKEVKPPYDGMSDCWECTSHKPDCYGYPKHAPNGRTERVYRTIYKQNFGEIPPGLVVRHKCDNRLCINPDHLELGTFKDNATDRERRGRNKSVLTISDVQCIKRSSEKNSTLAEMYGVARVTIWQIKTGRRYSWL